MKLIKRNKVLLIIFICVAILVIGIRFAYIRSIDTLYSKVEKQYAAQYAVTTPFEADQASGNPNTATSVQENTNTSIKDKTAASKQESINNSSSKQQKKSTVSHTGASNSTKIIQSSEMEKGKETVAVKEKDKEVKSTGVPKVSVPLPISAKTLDSKAEAVTGMKIETDDYMAAGAIILKKLGLGEIKFLFGAAKDDLFLNTSVEELERIRANLLSKLSTGDIDTLRIIGHKYGKAMYILDPNVDIREHKAAVEKEKAKAEAAAN